MLLKKLSVFLCIKELVAKGCNCAAHKGSKDEYPYGTEAAAEESGAEGTGGVYGSAGEMDAQDMNQGKAEADYKTGNGGIFNF